MARQFAEHYGKPMTSGSDIHDMTRLAKGGIETDHEIKTPEDLVKVLRSGEYRLIEKY
jgi:adenine deaminase